MDPRTVHTSLSDDDLMHIVHQGVVGQVESALGVIQSRHGHRVRKLIQGMVQDEFLAQDVAQETFVKVFFKSHLYELGTSFKSWVLEIARNQARSALRTRRRAPRPVTSLHFVEPDGDSDFLETMFGCGGSRELEEAEFMACFHAAVASLPKNYQVVFRECVMGGRAYQDVARELAIPTGTVAIRIMRARKRLFDALSPHLDRLRRPPACVQ
ncbi:MAG: RNA polymerase sigma factor [Planctomycetes bacterium]|nr:RNA polymerase sigma factor [Planctomycetota bacterium]